MRIDYTLEDEDYVRFNIYHSTHAPSQKRTQLLYRFGAPALLALILLHGTGWREWRFGMAAGVYVLWMIAWPYFHRFTCGRIVRRMMKDGRRNEFVGDFNLELTEEALRETGSGRTTEVEYGRIDHVAHDGDLHYIYTGSLSAFIVPERAFKDEQEKEAFFGMLEKKSCRGAVSPPVRDFLRAEGRATKYTRG